MPEKPKGLYEFGPFRFDLATRTLLRDGQGLAVGLKALETLAALLDNPGQLVEKDDLLKTVWPDTIVEEGNLAVQISLLRKALGSETYIETVPRRGYRFVATVRKVEAAVPRLQPADPIAAGVAAGSAAPPQPRPTATRRRWLLGRSRSDCGGRRVVLGPPAMEGDATGASGGVGGRSAIPDAAIQHR